MNKPGAPIAPMYKVSEAFIALVRSVLVLVEGLNIATAALCGIKCLVNLEGLTSAFICKCIENNRPTQNLAKK